MQIFSSNAVTPITEYRLLQNVGIAASVGSNALTISLKTADGSDPSPSNPVKIGFRSSTLTSGTHNIRSSTAATSVVVSSGSTLGTVDGVISRVYVWAIDNAGTIELAVSGSLYPSTANLDNQGIISTTAEGGAGAADSASIAYSTTQRIGVPCVLLACIQSTQATAGTWATAPVAINLNPFEVVKRTTAEYAYNTSNGYGSTNTAIRKFTNNPISSDAFGLLNVSNSATNGLSITAIRRCKIFINYTENANQLTAFGITKNGAQNTTDMLTITNSSAVLARTATPGNDLPGSVSVHTIAAPGDVFRPHQGGYAAGATTSYVCLYVFAEEI